MTLQLSFIIPILPFFFIYILYFCIKKLYFVKLYSIHRGLMTITKFRNYYEISDYKFSKWDKENKIYKGTCYKLDNKLCTYEYFRNIPRRKDSIKFYDKKTKTLRIPIGVDFDYVQQLLLDNGITYDFIDRSEEYIYSHQVSYDIDGKYQIRNKYQAEGIDFLTSEELFYDKLLALATGYGKTYVAIVAAFRMKMPILVISETLCDQWIERIQQYTSCRYNTGDIVLIKGTANFLNQLTKKSFHQAAFYITTSSTLSAALDSFGKDKVNEILERLGIGIKCFDEYHMHFHQNVKINMLISTKYTWYLTATPTRTENSEKRVFDFIMNKIPMYGLDTFKIDAYFNFRLINYNTNPSIYDVQKCVTSKGLSPVLYWNYIFENKDRLMKIIKMLQTLVDELLEEDENMKIIIYMAKLEHIDIIKQYMEKYYDNKDLEFGNYTSQVKKKFKRYQINKNIIFTTIGSGGVGLDVPDLRASMCLVPFTSAIICSQIIGRLRFIKDKELYFYDFIDEGFKTMEYQRRKRLNIYKLKAKTIKLRKFY